MGQTFKIENGTDVIVFLKSQHEHVKALFEQVIDARGTQRERSFQELRRLMAVHETAEEEVIHPAARATLPGGNAIVAQRLHEENEAKTALTALETLDIGSTEFDRQIRELQKNVLAHAQSEETEEFEKLADKLDASKLARMKKAVIFAESVAPTHPHAGIESAAANMIVGPFASMVDRVRDAFARRS